MELNANYINLKLRAFDTTIYLAGWLVSLFPYEDFFDNFLIFFSFRRVSVDPGEDGKYARYSLRQQVEDHHRVKFMINVESS